MSSRPLPEFLCGHSHNIAIIATVGKEVNNIIITCSVMKLSQCTFNWSSNACSEHQHVLTPLS